MGDMEFLENKVKNTLRKKFNITAKSYKELLKGQGKRTKQVDSAAKKKVAADLFSDSDLDDWFAQSLHWMLHNVFDNI